MPFILTDKKYDALEILEQLLEENIGKREGEKVMEAKKEK